MTCVKPLDAWEISPGEIVFNDPGDCTFPAPRRLQLPCGKCIGCLSDRVRDWSLRCSLEASLHAENCFVTLTYDEKHLPLDGSLDKRALQLFMKRLRKKYSDKKIRFFACGEYGKQKKRPHYHVLLFGFTFPDLRLWCRSGTDRDLYYRSAELEKLWPFGYSIVGSVTPQSAAYVARYCHKKMRGSKDVVADYYGKLVPEFIVMSRRPGIGADFFNKFRGDFYPKDFINFDSRKWRPPRYFDKCLRRDDELVFLEVKRKRIDNAVKHFENGTHVHLGNHELLLEERQRKLIRVYEEEEEEF